MSARLSGWAAIRAVTVLTYAFLFGPVLVVILLSFNPLEFGSFPLKGLTLRWYAQLVRDGQIADAVETSLLLGSATALISTAGGVAAALALARYSFPGKHVVSTLLTLPILLPQVVLGVAVLLFLRSLGMPTSFGLLLLGHIVLTLPVVVLVAQSRLYAIPAAYEEAAMSLGANRWHAFKDVTLPLLAPAVLAGGLFAFTISFDDITATLFWKPTGIETVPTEILAMLRLAMSQEINALGTAMILVTLAVPLTAIAILHLVGRRRRL
ncbi:MAG TPA: ABC transporter permease [Candidatus Methylomirabilis sp.]|nr:ABC transporter permease [Candidatus Methylomirabilis sp.]